MKILSYQRLATLALGAGLFGLVSVASAGEVVIVETEQVESESWFEHWWNGKYGSGDWFGLRTTMEDYGLKLGGGWKGYFYGNTTGGLRTGGAFDEELKFTGELDFDKLIGIPGLKANGGVRWRDGNSPNNLVGASSTFNPSNIQSGKQWRLTPFYLTWQGLGESHEFLTIAGGWYNPYEVFANQPLSKNFVNNSIVSSKGIGANIPWSSSYESWGGYFKLKPSRWFYAMQSFSVAVPGATSTSNHGLFFAQTPNSGLYTVSEAGFTPKWTSAELPGKYAAGFYYFGVHQNSFFGETYSGPYGAYFQVDQMLFREPSADVETKTVFDKASGKKTIIAEEPKLNPQGLSWFNFFNFAPKYLNIMPFYFHTGLSYQGLIPYRDDDLTMIAFAYGNYSYYNILARNDRGQSPSPTYEALIEANYRIQLNKFLFFQPNLQAIFRPNGTGAVPNALVLGFYANVIF